MYSGAPLLSYPLLPPRSPTTLALPSVLFGRKTVYMWVCFCVTCVFVRVSLTQEGTKELLTQRRQCAVDSLYQKFVDMGLVSA